MMVNKLRWSSLAIERLIEIGKYIAQDSSKNAKKVVQEIRETARKIPLNPEAYSIVKQLPSPNNIYRFAICYRYKIIYKICPDYILILDIFHMSRDPETIGGFEDTDYPQL